MTDSRRMKFRMVLVPALALVLAAFVWLPGFAAEPDMATYTSYPTGLTSYVKPNIMIILDNSGSMNYNAYGSYPGDGGVVTDAPYDCQQVVIPVNGVNDDAEEKLSDGGSADVSSDLDLGRLGNNGSQRIVVGLRFQDVAVPRNAVITSATISFKANTNTNVNSRFFINGQAADTTAGFRAGSWEPFDGGHNISGRPKTAAQVEWSTGTGNLTAWTTGNRYNTPDLKTIVQEIVNRAGWNSGNSMVFVITPEDHNVNGGKRDAYSGDGGTSNAPILTIKFQTECPKYYGYFDPEAKYSYASNRFYRDANGPWSGNWLNWLAMRKVDVARKVIMGGLATSRTGGGNTQLYGETPAQTNRVYWKYYDSTGQTVSPYVGNYRYKIEGGYIKVYNSANNFQASYSIRVDKSAADEPADFYQGNVAGILQRVGEKARWGNMWFYSGVGNNQEGGFVSNRIGSNITNMVTDLQNTKADTWTPLGETYYVCSQYFKQQKPESGLGYSNSAVGALNNTNDPYYNSGFVHCAKSFVILITDGASTQDPQIPNSLKNYAGEGVIAYPDNGTSYLRDVALYARTVDLRPDLEGNQNIMLYPIYAFGNDPNARELLRDAARLGGFVDKNGNNRPDGTYASPAADRIEWDLNGDGDPDTYFEAQEGYTLERKLLAAITDILKRASSGTAVSVLATSAEGEGTLVQAYFRPSLTEGLDEITWLGYLHSLWVDNLGRVREDTPPQGSIPSLDIKHDRIVEFFYDQLNTEAKFRRYELDSNGDRLLTFTDQNSNGVFDQSEPYIDINSNKQWDDGDPFTDVNGNGFLDAGEAYNDLNGNGIWDAGEPFTDSNGNGRRDDAEHFDDANGDGLWTLGEPFTDVNGNGVYDYIEPLTDLNANGVWDPAEPFNDLNGNGHFDDEEETYTDSNGDGMWNDAELYVDSNGNGAWDPAEPYVDSDGNGEYTLAEALSDLNGNGVWDGAEPYVDSNGDGIYNAPEPLTDLNGNGLCDAGEAWTDSNGNGVYDPPEPYSDTNGNGIWDAGEPFHEVYTEHGLEELNTIWSGGEKLHARTAASRTIKTFVDLNKNGNLDAGEYLDFSTANVTQIAPFLGVKNDTAWAYLGTAKSDRTNNLIKFIRGENSGFTSAYNIRKRTIDGNVWKLSDIVHSTPLTIGRPLDNYGLIYGDQTYQAYLDKYRNREQVVYVGGNGGMLHAFYAGRFNEGDISTTPTVTESAYFDKASGITTDYGAELWSYIPQALLPHLKWLASPDYTHVYYVDLKPKVVDARIFSDDPVHPNGWGTVLLVGLNMGGKDIGVTDDFPEGTNTSRTFKSSYTAFDVTDPHNPVLLWEKTFTDLSLTVSSPSVAKVDDSWFAIVGSGPTEYDGTSTHKGHVFVLDLRTGTLLRDFQAIENNAFMGAGPVTVDMGLNYNVDVGYIGETYTQGSNWRGRIYRLNIPKLAGDARVAAQTDVYDDNPANWSLRPIFDSDGPITASPGVSIDSAGNLWVYFGTGRYFSDADKSDLTQQYFYGFKDPVYNAQLYSTLADALAKPTNGFTLLDATPIDVFTDGSIRGAPAGVDEWNELLALMKSKDGWKLLLGRTVATLGERVLNKPTILGGIVFDTTFIPNQDVCGFEGRSNILGLYFETGTAYPVAVFVGGTEEVVVGGLSKVRVLKTVPVDVGRASSVSIHVGQQEGATGYVQQSTGIIQALELNPAFKVRSGFIYWRER